MSRRDLFAAPGIFIFAIGLAHREAFLTIPGAALVLTGVVLLLACLFQKASEPGPAYPVIFLVLAVTAALAPYDPAGVNLPESLLTVAAGLAFYLFGLAPSGRRYRLYAAAGLLVAAHVHYLLRFPAPAHEDVFQFLNQGVDLLARGKNPYLGVPVVESGVHISLTYTYPPGALVVLAPFRLLLGDVRWAYVAAEALVVLTWRYLLASTGHLSRGREALVLIPLVLPRTSQAFYIFSNHEWVLLALALAGLVLLARGREVAAGVCLGIGVVSKQYFLLFPALFLVPALTRRTITVALVTAACIVAPFLAWAPGPFLRDIFGNVAQSPDPDRLTLWALANTAGVAVPRPLLAALSVAALLLVLVGAWWTRQELPRAILVCGVSLAVFVLCSGFAAFNYYAYALTFVCWGLLLPLSPGLTLPPTAMQPEGLRNPRAVLGPEAPPSTPPASRPG